MAIKTVQVIINGTTVTATKGDGDTYIAQLTAPTITSYNVNSGHYYPVTVIATNAAGTSTTVNDQTPTIGESLRLKVREVSAPTIAVTSPTSDQYFGTSTPTIKFTITDEGNGSGVSISTLKIVVEGVTYTNTSKEVTVSSISNGYSVTCVPTALEDGAHSVQISVADNDGNNATSTVRFTTDTIAPTMNVTNPATSGTYVANAQFTVSGTASDSTSGTPTIEITLNGSNQGNVEVKDGSFNKSVTLVNGSNTIVVTATDKVGKVTTITRTIILDTSSPVIASVVINPNPVNVGENYTVTITVTG